MRLGINIDHVATIRNARGSIHPDPLKAAKIAEKSGADGITAHLREDRRHISDQDIKALKENISIPLNLEMAATEEMLEIALDSKPERVCLVPEKRLEVTTEGGLDLLNLTNKKESFVFDRLGTLKIGDNMVKTLAWYDNGYNHARRILDVILLYRNLD